MHAEKLSVSDELYRRTPAKPFVPFIVRTKDGQEFRVVRQFQAAANDRMMIVGNEDGRGSNIVRPDNFDTLLPVE